ncbi:tandem-95 repeat protein [Isoptericola sp. NEAU-Y5]|uniref:Tandem-95 repeat protein n=1 Tax=Isoptericola luteus TaxID=2879484 RepID=A0ABS7ZJ86_9MICO|nr:Ig-like domain-containing protein [Isoptericola sp. NEAU-Y5]MCA5895058.1 tandem-95 repeat protein [Isoptericola sp. NEAU-Y5]
MLSLSAGVVLAAVLYDGEATADVDLDDSGVWVTKESAGMVGRFNTEAKALDGTLLAGSADFDVDQQASQVLVADTGSSAANVVDVARLKFRSTTRLPAGAEVSMGGGRVAVVDDESGSLWVTSTERLATLDTEETDPAADLDGAAQVVVSQGGTTFVVVPARDLLWTVEPGTEPVTTELGLLDEGDEVELTTVGDDVVVLDRTDGELRLPGGDVVPVSGAQGARLQQPGESSDTVAYATAAALVRQPLDGGAATTRKASGSAAAPVQLGGCLYGAWSTTGQIVRDCEGTDRDVDRVLEGVDQSTQLEYRTNRDAVVLNDLTSGILWMALDDYEKVDDWDIKLPEQEKGDDEDAEDAEPELVDQTVLDREKQDPPEAVDDRYGVRPGRATVLDVLSNDTDQDGDVMTAALEGESPDAFDVQRVLGGKALQAVTSEDASGSATFAYEVSDGRGGTDQGSVEVTVVPWEENAAPEQSGTPVLRVEQGKSASIKVLPYFLDPDGDDVYLATAAATVQGDEVRAYPDGTVEFRDGGSATGRKKVSLTVGDGLGEVVEGTLWVDVFADTPEPPVAVGDHVVATAGQPVTVEPLKNDTDPNGDDLRLSKVNDASPAEITRNLDAGTFTFLAHEAGSYDVLYQVTDGPGTTTGVVRVDVQDADEAAGAPIVVADTALLPAGGSTLVDVLANDTDPAGGVLVVQSVDVPDDAGVSVAVLGHQMLRITETRRISDAVTLEYTVSNGNETATGQVRVLPVPAPDRLQPPNAAADEVTVRAGDYVNIDVLDNDSHPDGLELTLDDELEQTVDEGQGELFASEGRLRFRAGAEPGTAYAIYTVRDPNGQEDSAQVTIHVRGGKENSAPVPLDVDARVLSGGTVRIPVPLDGIDPDGDSVQLTGLATGPAKGRAEVVDGFVDYEAGKNASGADSFRYTVQDARGEVATGLVRVGIAQPPATNQSPVAADDEVTVRPDRRVAVRALANDTDPDGDRVGLVAGALEGLDDGDGDIDAEVDQDRIVVQTPGDEGTSTFFYAIEDTYGARASAAVSVTVSADAPLLPPIARDDSVPVADILGATTVTVPVLDNDEDPDGAADDLEVAVEGASATTATVTSDGELAVTLTRSRQVITYTVTDMDGQSAKAFVVVPGVESAEPILKPGQAPLEVLAGESIDIDITDHVLVVEGRTPRLTTTDQVTALEGDVEVTDATTMTYTARTGYEGPAGVTFEVTDGTSVDDPEGNVAVLTLPITVLPPENLPPTPGKPSAEVAAGEESSVDLGRFARDPDDDALRFELGALPGGVGATLSGSTVTLEASPDVPKGTALTVPYTVTDDEHAPVDGTLAVEVVASTRPLARAVDDVVDDAHQGKAVAVPVLANDSNPFAEREPLTVVGEPIVETGVGSAVSDGDQVVVTPKGDFVGTMVVRYTVQDATQDPDRQVEGRITVNVLGVPEAPARPVVEEVRSETVVLSWTPPQNNGAEITGYTVTSSQGDVVGCATTTCTLDGLTNDVTYTFTVQATNVVGDSKASPASPEARPDEKPDPPAAPTLAFGDSSLTVTWKNAVYSDRSAIQSVDLEISPAPANGESLKAGVTGQRIEWEGLTNGTAYKVRIRAINLAPDPSDWGAWSTSEIPAGPPDAPAAPSAARVDTELGGQIHVEWKAPVDNGDAVATYHVDEYVNGNRSRTLETAQTSLDLEGLDTKSTYTYRVTAENKAGKGDTSPASNEVTPFGKPGSPGTPTAKLGSNTSGRATVSWGAADPNGNPVTYQVQANNAGTKTTTSTSMVYTGLSNGTGYTFQVRACNQAGCSAWAGPSGKVTPYTTPSAPGVAWTRTSADQGQFKVTAPSSNGGRAVQRIEWRFTAGDSGSGSKSSTPFTITTKKASGTTFTLQARACNAAGCGAWRSGSGTTPTPTATVSRGGATGVQDGCQSGNCNYFRVTVKNFPSGSHRVECWSANNPASTEYGWHNIIMSGGKVWTSPGGPGFNKSFGGDTSFQLDCYYGYPGTSVAVVIDGKRYGASTW